MKNYSFIIPVKYFANIAFLLVSLAFLFVFDSIIYKCDARQKAAQRNSSTGGANLPAESFKMYWGSIDKYKISMKLRIKEGKLTGYYFYDKVKTPLKLKGTVDKLAIFQRMGSNATIEEFDGANNKTGQFKGVLTDYEFFGEWTNKKRLLKFKLVAVDSAGKGSLKIKRKQDARYKADNRDGVVVYPEVSGGNSKALEKISKNLTFGEVFDPDVQGWLNKSTYYVNYNKNNILDIVFWQEGIGSYPDSSLALVAFDLKTGNFLRAKDIFKPESIDKVLNLLNEALNKQIQKSVKEIPEDESEARKTLLAESKEAKFDLKRLEVFSISDDGITFVYCFGFPHAIKALEPEGIFFFPYSELKKYINPRGALSPLLFNRQPASVK